MGGCCCCASKGPPLSTTPAAYYYCPRTSEEQVPLSSHHSASSALFTGFLIDATLDTSIPETYIPPPAPLPFDVALRHPRTPLKTQEIYGNKSDTSVQTINDVSVQESYGGNTKEVSKCDDLKGSDCKVETGFDETKKDLEVELSKPAESFVSLLDEDDDDDDSCPICLEEYDAQNPKFITKCEHHFHLACILEWMERSDTCPMCDQEMVLSPSISW